ncbi:MAG TPA: tripartite tricarboxylate transporter substrate binding protein [Burkholderiales bacterium]|nr:tripartite tricarboxylate transporter substrate binding protein [Burkholderiales bacterium]
MRGLLRLVVAACCAAAFAAHAQAYPTKSIRLIVPFAPGGGTDLIGRIVAQQMSEALGHQFVVDNRGGAGSVLGSDLASKAPPDGYTLLLGNISLAFNASLYRKLPFDVLRDFAPITLVAVQPNILVINPGLPAKSLKDFVELARAEPGRLTYASAGTGSGTHLAMELLKLQLELDIVHVPYKGTGPALTDVIGGQVSSMLSTFASALPHVKTGRLRALGVTSKTRSAAAPDVPTLTEAGVPDYEYATWYGLLAPRGTPPAIVGKLAKTAGAVLVSEDAKRKLEAQGVETLLDTPAQFAEYLKSETAKWAKVVKAAHISQQ